MAQSFDKAEAARIARTLIHTARDAAFGTLDSDGFPNVSHVAAATLVDGTPLILNSDLAVHTRNARRDPRVSLLYVAEAGEGPDTNTRARVTLTGRLEMAPGRSEARSRFIRRHPDAEFYVDFGDMHLMRMVPERGYLVAGFGRITTISADALLSPTVDGLAEIDAGACQHMDEDHADALALIATRLAGAGEGSWRAVGVDALGIDLACGDQGARAEYQSPLPSAGALRVALKQITDSAREGALG